jgi:type VI secretion system protein ImpH
MASADGRETTDLSRLLFARPERFDFFQAVRLLEQVVHARARQGQGPPTEPIGLDSAPVREFVRFGVLPSLSFPAGAVAGLRARDGTAPPEMVVPFLGLTGPLGVLPAHYTALLLRRLREKDFALRDFLDLFHHRLLSLFYRAWEKYRLPFAHERFRLVPRGRDADPTTGALYCLTGFGTAGLRGRLQVPDEAFLFYAGHFAHWPRSASALEGLLEDYFEVRVRVLSLQGQWLPLSEADRAVLPESGGLGRNNRLGVDLVIGDRVRDVQSKFRLRVGPLTFAQFRRLMPDGDGLRPLCQLTRTYVGAEFDFDVQAVLLPAEVPWCRLSADPEPGPRLGWNTWLRSREFSHEVEDAVFALDAV